MRNRTQYIKESVDIAQERITKLWEHDPGNSIFEQVGLRDGRDIVNDYLDHGEWALALEHLLYMIHESEIEFPKSRVTELHRLADRYGVKNRYK